MDKIAFIESNTTGTGKLFIETAQQEGLEVLFLTKQPEKYPFLKTALIHPIFLNTDDPEELFSYLKKIEGLVGILSTSERYVYQAAVVAQKLKLPCTNPQAIASCRDKYGFITHLKNVGVPFIRTANKNEGDFDFPVVVKPNPGTGSIGVRLCHSSDELSSHIQSLNRPFIIQEYIQGEEYSAEIVVQKGACQILGLTKKYLGPEPYFVEYGHDFPAKLSHEIGQEVSAIFGKVLEEIGFDFGPVHIEFRLRDEKIYIIEINPRLAGGMIPILIEQSKEIPLIKNLIHLFIGNSFSFEGTSSFYTKIAFLIPEREGILKEIKNSCKHGDEISFEFYKKVGDRLTLKGDFSDRIGHIIVKSKSIENCIEAIEKAKDQITFSIQEESTFSRGRLSEPIDPRVKQILEESTFQDFDELACLSKINRAHVDMLEACQIILPSQAKKILHGIEKLEEENFASIRKINDSGIGFYLSYEQRLIEEIGIKTAGLIHTGRSRNDVNATIQRFKSKEICKELYRCLWGLRSDLLQVAHMYSDVSMPIYSQYQAAIPGTYAYYLLAVEEALATTQESFHSMTPFLKTSPLGGAAGGGTTYPIDPEITAKTLGFQKGPLNALTVVGTRDFELTLLSLGAILGTTISRIAQDFHMWLTREFAFFELPDRLCGISSSMPQKKNPYLLEKIKGKSIRISGTFATALATIQKVPFANSVEVGTEAFIEYAKSFSELIKAMKLISLIVQGARPVQENMARSNREGLTVSTQVAEDLARTENISFREAHDRVGGEIQKALSHGKNPLDSILKLVETVDKDPRQWHQPFEYGRGAGTESTRKMNEKGVQRLNGDRDFFFRFSELIR